MGPIRLTNLRIAAPCPAEWRWMRGDDRVRFCGQCNLYVYNLTALTRDEAESLIRRTEGRICVRFYRRRDGTILTQNCPVGLRAVKRKLSRVATAAITLVLGFMANLGLVWAVNKVSGLGGPIGGGEVVGIVALPPQLGPPPSGTSKDDVTGRAPVEARPPARNGARRANSS